MSPGTSTSQTRERLRANVRPRGEGGGAAREGAALLQGIAALRALRAADAGRLFRDRGGRVPRYACVRGRDLHATGQTLPVARRRAAGQGGRRRVPGGGHPGRRRRDRRRRSASSSDQHEAAARRPAAGASSAPSSRPSARGASSTPASPSTGSSRARSNARSRTRSPPSSASSGKLAALEQCPARAAHRRRARKRSARLARDLPRLWEAETTTDRDRKELLRTLISEVIVTVAAAEAAPTSRSSGRAARAPSCGVRAQPPRARTPPHARGHVELIRRLAAASPRPADRRDPQPARPAHRDRAAVHRGARPSARVSAPASRPRRHRTPTARLVTIAQRRHAARRLDRHDPPLAPRRPAARRADHPRRALADPAHRRGPRPVRARHPRRLSSRSTRPRAGSASRARPCCIRSNAASASAIEVTQGRRNGLRIEVRDADAGLFDHP